LAAQGSDPVDAATRISADSTSRISTTSTTSTINGYAEIMKINWGASTEINYGDIASEGLCGENRRWPGGPSPANPFAGIKLRSVPDRSRSRFVTREETQRVLDACPDREWRLMVALALPKPAGVQGNGTGCRAPDPRRDGLDRQHAPNRPA